MRQHIRGARIETLWVLEDWNLEWTVIIDRGKVRFDRRPARAPEVTLSWPGGAEFLAAVEAGRSPDESRTIKGNVDHFRIYVEPLYRSFCRSLEEVIKCPVDDAGNPLM